METQGAVTTGKGNSGRHFSPFWAVQLQRVWEALRHVLQPLPTQADSSKLGLSERETVSYMRESLRLNARFVHAHTHVSQGGVEKVGGGGRE